MDKYGSRHYTVRADALNQSDLHFSDVVKCKTDIICMYEFELREICNLTYCRGINVKEALPSV